MLGKLDREENENWTCKRMNLEHSLIAHTKINSKWIKDQSIRSYTVKLLEENTGRTLFDINCSNIFLDSPPRVMETKAKINRWNLIKPKSFYTAKEIINKMKRKPMVWENIFANDAANKELISKINKQVMQLNIRKTTPSENDQKT